MGRDDSPWTTPRKRQTPSFSEGTPVVDPIRLLCVVCGSLSVLLGRPETGAEDTWIRDTPKEEKSCKLSKPKDWTLSTRFSSLHCHERFEISCSSNLLHQSAPHTPKTLVLRTDPLRTRDRSTPHPNEPCLHQTIPDDVLRSGDVLFTGCREYVHFWCSWWRLKHGSVPGEFDLPPDGPPTSRR